MIFPAKEIVLKDGRRCLLRPASPADAAEMVAFMKRTAGETPFLLRNPDEVTYTAEEEAEKLREIAADPRCVMLAAVVDGKIAGNSGLGDLGPKRRLRHRCTMAITLFREYWGLGAGTAMIGYLTQLAQQIGYEQMDLEVVADNARALALYRKCGFIESGRRHHAAKLDDGTYQDHILMYKPLI